MAHLIDKDALVAEIEKKLTDILACKKDTSTPEERIVLTNMLRLCKEILSFLDILEVKEVDLMIHTIIAECCDWLASHTNLSHNEIESCRNLMLTVKEEHLKEMV